jgi:hypothetical protein
MPSVIIAAMGFLDAFGPRYKPHSVPLEGVRGIWSAANTRGGIALAGGQVAVTDHHVAFSPWDLDKTREWLFKLLGQAGAPGWVGKIDELITQSRLLEPVAIPVAAIGDVQVLNRASILKPPTARIRLADGGHFDIGIVARPTSPNFSGSNNQAFDDFLGALQNVRQAAAAPAL